MKRSLSKIQVSTLQFPLLTLEFLLTFSSCKKIVDKEIAAPPLSEKTNTVEALPVTPNGYCVTDQENVLTADSILKPTILGARLIGLPYAVVTMQQAYLSVYGSSTEAVVHAF